MFLYKNELFKFDKEFIVDTLFNSYKHPDTLFILPKNCSSLFRYFKDFKYIGNWDTSKVESMKSMFLDSEFNGDISDWDTSNVKDMSWMFAYSKFNGNISNWDVSKVKEMDAMFAYSKFNKNISKWNTNSIRRMTNMFQHSEFTGDISKWNIKRELYGGMF